MEDPFLALGEAQLRLQGFDSPIGELDLPDACLGLGLLEHLDLLAIGSSSDLWDALQDCNCTQSVDTTTDLLKNCGATGDDLGRSINRTCQMTVTGILQLASPAASIHGHPLLGHATHVDESVTLLHRFIGQLLLLGSRSEELRVVGGSWFRWLRSCTAS